VLVLLLMMMRVLSLLALTLFTGLEAQELHFHCHHGLRLEEELGVEAGFQRRTLGRLILHYGQDLLKV